MLRRGFFAALLAPLLSRVGLKAAGPARPVALPSVYAFRGMGEFTIHKLNEAYCACCWGSERPTVIAVPPGIWDAVWSSVHRSSRGWVDPNSDLSRNGWKAWRFNGAEMVADPSLAEGEVRMVNTKRQDDARYSARLFFTVNHAA